MRRLLSCLILATLGLATALAAAGSAIAQSDDLSARLALDVGLVEVRSTPGTTAIDRVKVINKMAAEAEVTAAVEDLGGDAAGDLVAVARGTGQRSASTWITLDDPSLDIPGNGTITSTIKVAVPKGTKPGGYYAAVTYDTESGRAPEERLYHAILVRVDGAGAQAQPELISLSLPTLSLNGTVAVEAILENGGNLHAIASGTLVVENFGSRVARVNIPPIVLLPNIQRVVKIKVPSPPVAGRLTAKVAIDFGDGNPNQKSANGFVLIWWLAAALGAVLLLFAAALLRATGVVGPKAAKRRGERLARAPRRSPAPAAAAPASAMSSPTAAAPSTGAARGSEMPPPLRPSAGPPLRPSAGPPPPLRPSAGPPPPLRSSAGPPPPLRPAPIPDRSFWGEDEQPAPFAQVEPEEEIVDVPAVPMGLDYDDEADIEDDVVDVEDDDVDVDVDVDLDRLDDDGGPVPDAAADQQDDLEDSPTPRALRLDDDEEDDDSDDALAGTSDDASDGASSKRASADPDVTWPGAVPTAPSGPLPPVPARPIAIARPAGSTGESAAGKAPDASRFASMPESELTPAPRVPRPIQVASLARRPEQAPLPAQESAAQPPMEITLGRTGSGSAMALRRAEVALRMINGKPGETGAILDAGLDLLYSVKGDPSVVAHIEDLHSHTRNRRKLGPVALAMFAVDSRIAPEALLDAYATASKVVADRLRKAIMACDPADVRRHRSLINALPPARRDALGL